MYQFKVYLLKSIKKYKILENLKIEISEINRGKRVNHCKKYKLKILNKKDNSKVFRCTEYIFLIMNWWW